MDARPGGDLPIAPFLPEIAASLRGRGALVLAAEPGAGKTSLVPPALARAMPGRILVTEPRRLAAVAAAARMARLEGVRLGEEIGYRVKGESRCGSAARIEVVTEGILVRMLQDDPSLPGVGAIVFDEIHERSLFADLGLALALEARALRPELAILAMSATVDVEGLAGRLGAAPLRVPGSSHPILTRHAPIPDSPGFDVRFAELALDLAEEAEGDVLAFLPGAAEIDRVARTLQGRGIEAVPLMGSQSLQAQRRVLEPAAGSPRRIVLATAVAETSLTVPRVRAVLDSGLARLSRYHPRTGLNRLVTEREARDRAEQRRGRAGRLGPGLCLRAWPASDALSERTEPEIARAELSGLALESAVWGARARLGLPWLDPPPEPAWERAVELLRELGALDASGRATERGRAMAALGTEPRLAALVLAGADRGELALAAELAALLGERDSTGERDLAERLERLRRGAGGTADGTAGGSDGSRGPASGGDGSAGRPGMDRDDLARVRAEARRLEAAARAFAGQPPSGRAASAGGLGPLLALAYPDRVARRETASAAAAPGRAPAQGRPGASVSRGPDALFRLPSGRALRAGPPLSGSAWIVAAEADAGAAEGRVFSGAAIPEEDALRALAPIAQDCLEVEWEGLAFRARRVRRAGRLVLFSAPAPPPPRAEVAALLCARVAREGLSILPWDQAGAGGLLARLRWWAAAGPPLPALDDASLAAGAAEWLAPFVAGDPAAALDGAALRRALESLLTPSARRALDAEAPERLDLPSGSSRPVDYARPGGPAVEARVQEFFGLSEHPKVAGRPLVLSLLDPGGKPLQVTSDLSGFWRGAWAQARRELRGRYPKHDWPEDPASAVPSRSGIKKRR